MEDKAISSNNTEFSHISSTNATSSQRGTERPKIGSASLLNAGIWASNSLPSVDTVEFVGKDGKPNHFTGFSGTKARVHMGMTASVWNAFSSTLTEENLWPESSCASGNCSWDSFTSIAVCSRCNDISSHIKKFSGVTEIPEKNDGHWTGAPPNISNPDSDANFEEGNKTFTKFSIPQVGLYLANYNGPPRCCPTCEQCPDTNLSATFMMDPAQTLTMKDSRTMVMALQYLSADQSWQENKTKWEDTPINAEECSLYFCINEYKSTLEQGVLYEEVLSSWSNKTPRSYYSEDNAEYLEYLNYTLDVGPGYANLTDLQIFIPYDDFKAQSRSSKFTQQRFNITQATVVTLLNIFHDGLGDSSCGAGNFTCYKESQPLIYPSLGGKQALPFMVGFGESGDMSGRFQKVASSITKWIRDSHLASTPVLGMESRMVTVTRVQWQYLVFPAIILLIGSVFVVLSIWETQHLGQPGWKDSALVTLACTEKELKEMLQEASIAGSMEVLARKTRVVLEQRDGICQMVRREGQDQKPEEASLQREA